MKNLVVIFVLVLLLSACGSETKGPEVTANKAAVSEEIVEAEATPPPIEEEAKEAKETEETEEIEEIEETEETEETLPVEVDEAEEVSVEQEEEFEDPVEEPEESVYTLGSGTITAEEIKALVPDYFGAGEVKAVEVNGEDIFVSVNMETEDLFTPADLAVNSYSQLSDELLFYDGWNRLTVEFIGIGTIDMNISEAESNEFGDYFPTLVIEERLF
ncbi:hypothetical protein L1279_000555 [Planomicrobium sp. HSC-17F08]|nr:hypothetical protein [Planomicrobium sp. HSC-17F08]